MNKQFETGRPADHRAGVSISRRNLLKLTGVGVVVLSLTSGNAPIQPGGSGSPLGDGIDFVINVPSGSNNVTVRYVRVVRTAEVAVPPSIKVHYGSAWTFGLRGSF